MINKIFSMPGVICAVIDVVPVIELKESGLLSCPSRMMINTRDGMMSGLINRACSSVTINIAFAVHASPLCCIFNLIN